MSMHEVSRRLSSPGRNAKPRTAAVRSRFKAAAIPEIQSEVVRRVRARLAAGFYDLPECLDAAIDKFIERECRAARRLMRG